MKNYIKQRLREDLNYNHVSDATKDEYIMTESITVNDLHFSGGRFNKNGHNTIMYGEEPIVDFGVGAFGELNIGGQKIPNALYLQGGYNATIQKRGYGSLGLQLIFKKLPKIQNIVLQCYDSACGFWTKMGGKEITNKKINGKGVLRTLCIKREDFKYKDLI